MTSWKKVVGMAVVGATICMAVLIVALIASKWEPKNFTAASLGQAPAAAESIFMEARPLPYGPQDPEGTTGTP